MKGLFFYSGLVRWTWVTDINTAKKNQLVFYLQLCSRQAKNLPNHLFLCRQDYSLTQYEVRAKHCLPVCKTTIPAVNFWARRRTLEKVPNQSGWRSAPLEKKRKNHLRMDRCWKHKDAPRKGMDRDGALWVICRWDGFLRFRLETFFLWINWSSADGHGHSITIRQPVTKDCLKW